jgi:hypothetical protein
MTGRLNTHSSNHIRRLRGKSDKAFCRIDTGVHSFRLWTEMPLAAGRLGPDTEIVKP